MSKRINGVDLLGVDRNLSSNEKLAKSIVGIESNAILTSDERSMENLVKAEATSKFNEQVDSYVNKLDNYEKKLEDHAKMLSDNLNGVEAKPTYEGVLIKPFAENPFQRVQKSGSLIIDTGGLAPEYKSNEDGEWHEEEQFIKTGVVIEVGPTCKYVNVGDIVMWRKPSETPVPFYKQGWVQVNEHSIMTIFNEGLSERFKAVNDNGK